MGIAMHLRFASVVFVFALVVAGCGKDKSSKSDEISANDGEGSAKSAKPLVPGAGYHSSPSDTAPNTETSITSDPSASDDEPKPIADPPVRKDTGPADDEPKKKKKKAKKKKRKSGGKQSVKLEGGVGDLKLNGIAIAPDVQERVPVDVKRRYSEAPEVFWCWTNFSNTGDETKVTHVWRHKNKVRTRIEVTVGSGKRWRSWSRHRPGDKSGEWSCEILDAEGKRLGRASVTIGG